MKSNDSAGRNAEQRKSRRSQVLDGLSVCDTLRLRLWRNKVAVLGDSGSLISPQDAVFDQVQSLMGKKKDVDVVMGLCEMFLAMRDK